MIRLTVKWAIPYTHTTSHLPIRRQLGTDRHTENELYYTKKLSELSFMVNPTELNYEYKISRTGKFLSILSIIIQS